MTTVETARETPLVPHPDRGDQFYVVLVRAGSLHPSTTTPVE